MLLYFQHVQRLWSLSKLWTPLSPNTWQRSCIPCVQKQSKGKHRIRTSDESTDILMTRSIIYALCDSWQLIALCYNDKITLTFSTIESNLGLCYTEAIKYSELPWTFCKTGLCIQFASIIYGSVNAAKYCPIFFYYWVFWHRHIHIYVNTSTLFALICFCLHYCYLFFNRLYFSTSTVFLAPHRT